MKAREMSIHEPYIGGVGMAKTSDTKDVPHPGNKIHIPLPEREAVRLLGKVKPTADMPRPGAAKKAKKQKAKRGRVSKNQ
jgi:hypothetical protein